MQHFISLIVILACVASGAVAQQGDRTAVLREVLRATVLSGYPWRHPSPTVVSSRTTGPCEAHWCPGPGFTAPTSLPDTLQRFVRDSLHSELIGAGSGGTWSCQTDRAPGMITLAEPGFHGDSAFVGVAWHGCVRTALVPFLVPQQLAHAILLLRRDAGGWKIVRMTQQSISLAPQEGPPAPGAEGERAPGRVLTGFGPGDHGRGQR